jgi:ribulose-5-phosphate 4-epimerase/fuculose-1-phosphate aldolase
MSSTQTETDATLHLSSTPAQGIHNLTLGTNEYVHKRPTFSDKHKERRWMLEHMAAAFRAFGRRKFGVGIAGHISVRDPVDPSLFWINPLGKHFSLMTVSDFIQVDKNGNIVGGNTKGVVNLAGFKIHSEIHEKRPDVNAACHAHSTFGTAYSTFGKELEMINQDVCIFYKKHSVYEDFGGVVLDREEGKRIAESLDDGKAIILQNHGLLTVGETIDEAVALFLLMEKACEIQLLADSVDSSKYPKKIINDKEAAYTYYMTSDPESLYSEFQPEYEYEMEMTNGAFLK